MRQYAVLAIMTLAAGATSARAITTTIINENGRHITTSRSSAGTKDGRIDLTQTKSLLRTLGSYGNNASWLYSGRVPQTYLILGLTDEQTAALENICGEARQAYRDASKELYANRTPGKRMDPAEMRERHRKFNEMRDEMTDRYATRMRDVLTEEQRETLAAIEKLVDEWRAEEAKIREVLNLALQKNRENYEEELEGLLSEEQLAALKRLEDERANRRRGGKGRGTPPKRGGPDSRQLKPAEDADPLETF